MSTETAGFGAFELPPEALGSPAPTLPVLGRIGVVEVAVVAKADWLELVMLRAKRNLDHAREVAKAASCVVPSGLSTIEKDAEVASFLRERFRGRMTIEALHAACVEAFGHERAPVAQSHTDVPFALQRPPMSDGPAPEPIRSAVAGVELVTIPVTHYAELLDCQRRLAMVRASSERFAADPRSRIDRDPEVAFFLAECFGRMLLKDAYAACRERFGQVRTPGRSSIDRYWKRLRRG